MIELMVVSRTQKASKAHAATMSRDNMGLRMI